MTRCVLAYVLSFLPILVSLTPSVEAQERELSISANDPRGSVVQLLAIGPAAKGKNCKISATGFFVNEDGYLLTNAHVVDDARRCLARSPEAKILAKLASPAGRAAPAVSCNVVAVDEVHDLAVLKTERPPAQVLGTEKLPFALLDSAEVQVGSAVVVTGHPTFAWRPVTQTGRVLRRERICLSASSAESSEVLAVNIAPQVGNSGGPVYVPTGGVVAIVERKDPADASKTLAVSIHHAINLLNRLRIKWYGANRQSPICDLRFAPNLRLHKTS